MLFGHYLWNYFRLYLNPWNSIYLLKYFIRVKYSGWFLGKWFLIYKFYQEKYFHKYFFHRKDQVYGTCHFNWKLIASPSQVFGGDHLLSAWYLWRSLSPSILLCWPCSQWFQVRHKKWNYVSQILFFFLDKLQLLVEERLGDKR